MKRLRSSSRPVSAAPAPPGTSRPFVVGIGASAGGLQALQAFFRAVNPATRAAYIVVQHLSPDFKSFMVELLAKHTPLTVLKAEDGQQVQPGKVYLIPPKVVLRVVEDKLRLQSVDLHAGLQMPVDVLFRSLAENSGKLAISIVLSGTGSDGTAGVRAIKDAGGLVMVQDEATAQFNGMPRSAIATGLADYVLAPEAMPAQLETYLKHPFVTQAASFARRGQAGPAKNELIAVVRERTGVDFGHYKAATIDRRIERRMSVCQIGDLSNYVDYVKSSTRETELLLTDVLIGVTAFFRDWEAWETLRTSILPELLRTSAPEEPIRAWVAGCSTGEEAYSLAMLISEILEQLQLQRTVKIFATDLSKEALAVASRGIYTPSETAGISPERLRTFFVTDSHGHQVSARLREMVVFAHHNLLRDPPFTRLSLITCRNLLIYLRPEMQERLLTLFNYALRNDGILFLGSSESIGESTSRFQALTTRYNLHRNRRLGQPPPLLAAMPPASPQATPAAPGPRSATDSTAGAEENLLDRVFEYISHRVAPPSVVIDERDDVVHVIGSAGDYLKPPPGRFTRNLLRLTPPGLSDAIRAVLQRARTRRDGVVQDTVRFRVQRRTRLVRLAVRPYLRHDRPTGLRLVFLEDLGAAPKLATGSTRTRLTPSIRQHIAQLERDLASTRDTLQSTVQELESSNEEIQAANEELLTANEELQSTNEELQSVNEELHTVNTENQNRIEELTRLTNDINNLLATAIVGVVLIDAQLRIRRASQSSLTLLGLAEEDLGSPIETLARLLRRPDLPAIAETVMQDNRPRELEVELTARNRWILVRLTPFRTELSRVQGVVLSFVDLTERHRAEEETRRQSAMTQSVLDAMEANVAVLNGTGEIMHVNRSWREFARRNGRGDPTRTGVGANYFRICATTTGPEAEDARACLEGMQRVLHGTLPYFRYDYPCHGPDCPRWFRLHVAPIAEGADGLVIAHLDITAIKQAEVVLAQARPPLPPDESTATAEPTAHAPPPAP